ncbi:MAG: T9SS type A sorting domain-containing protein [Flavobacteriales bacterium]|nr:T9SS type A sorting domain-containing protein [Flavobacteriales bacterium]
MNYFSLFIALLLWQVMNAQRITVTQDMVTNEKAYYDAFLLFDEDSVSDPLNGNAGTPITFWQNWILSSDFYPISAVVDLGTQYNITSISLFDGSGSGDVTIQTGTPFNWNTQFTDNMNSYLSWSTHNLNINSRYIRIVIDNPNIQLGEVVFYGSKTGTVNQAQPQNHNQPPMRDFIGINGFHVDPISRLSVAKHLREYHMWVWDEGGDSASSATYAGYPNNQYGFSPSWVTGWDIDSFYANATAAGIEVVPCLLTSPLWIVGAGNMDSLENKPIFNGEDPENPMSYAERADYFYQYVARYGQNTVPLGNLKLRSDNQPKTGLGYINYIEDWNEQDKYWKGRKALFQPYEYSAMLSADYDGHKSQLGTLAGAKNADPNIKVVMGGIAGLNLDFVKAMKFWSDHHRNGDFPADVINYHFYSNNIGGQVMGQSPSYPISPEEDNLYEDLKKLVDYRDKYLPGIEIWISEFGYDTDTLSPIGCKPYGPFSNEQVQAMWIIRTYLACVAAGIDRTQMYMLADVWSTSDTSASPGMFNTSGLTSDSYTGYKPKVSYFYLYAFRERLQNMTFDTIISSGNPNVNVYKFKSLSNPDSVAYCVWAPTHNNTQISNYQLQLDNPVTAKQVELIDQDTLGIETILSISNQSVEINVNENVKIILVEQGINSSVLGNNTQDSFEIYPNPCKEELRFNANDLNGSDRVIIKNTLGQQIKVIDVKPNMTIDVSALSKGTYLIGLQSKQTFQEFVKH